MLTKETQIAFYIQSTESASDVPFTIMLTKGINEYDYQDSYGKIMHYSETVNNYGVNDCEDGFALKSTINGAEISFAENDIILKTNTNTTSVNEILSKLADMGFSEGTLAIVDGTGNSSAISNLEIIALNGASVPLYKYGNFVYLNADISFSLSQVKDHYILLPREFSPKNKRVICMRDGLYQTFGSVTMTLSNGRALIPIDSSFTGAHHIEFYSTGWYIDE